MPDEITDLGNGVWRFRLRDLGSFGEVLSVFKAEHSDLIVTATAPNIELMHIPRGGGDRNVTTGYIVNTEKR